MEYGQSGKDHELEQWVLRSRRAQGLPDHVEDPVVLAHVADLLSDAWRHIPDPELRQREDGANHEPPPAIVPEQRCSIECHHTRHNY